MLGIGIFLAPSIVAERVGSIQNFYLMWACGGLIALAGSVAYAELGQILPKSGGDYVFQREAFGESIAFASGWLLFLAVFGGSIAAVAVGLCEYQLSALFGLDLTSVHLFGISIAKLIALMIVIGFTFLNRFACSISGTIQGILTIGPILLLAAGTLYAFGTTEPTSAAGTAAATAAETSTWTHTNLFFGFVMAYLPIYFAFSGWNGVIFLAGEVKNPARNLPLGLFLGTAVVTVLYLLLCAGFIHVIGFEGLTQVDEAGSEAAGILGGSTARIFITICIALGLMASLNGTILGGARVGFAMAKDGVLWSGFSRLSNGGNIPERALWLQAGWACLLILTESFEVILDLVSLAMLLSGSITVLSLYVLRDNKKSEESKRSIMYWMRKICPPLFIGVNALVFIGIAVEAWHSGMEGFDRFLGVILFVLAFLFHRLTMVVFGFPARASRQSTLTTTKFN